MVGIRTPHFKREISNGSPIDAALKNIASNAFDGTIDSRGYSSPPDEPL